MKTRNSIEVSLLVEVDATAFFSKNGEDTVNWCWCNEHATFKHVDACEFIVHVGEEIHNKASVFQSTCREMRKYGCTKAFIRAYEEAAHIGAFRVLFWA